jgi:hypothetical protein
MTKQRILFLCAGNSARSQMEEGFLRHFAGDRFGQETRRRFLKDCHSLLHRTVEQLRVGVRDHALARCAHCRNFRPGSAESELQLPFPGSVPHTGLCRGKFPVSSSFQCDAREVLARPGGFQRRLSHVARGIHLNLHTNLDPALDGAACVRRNLRHHPPHHAAPVVRVRCLGGGL